MKTSGGRLVRRSVQSALNSSEWFFFIMKARRKGAIISTVATPQTALPAQWDPVSSVESSRQKGRAKENISAMTAMERMP